MRQGENVISQPSGLEQRREAKSSRASCCVIMYVNHLFKEILHGSVPPCHWLKFSVYLCHWSNWLIEASAADPNPQPQTDRYAEFTLSAAPLHTEAHLKSFVCVS